MKHRAGPRLSDDLVDRYMRIFAVPRRAPSVDALRELVAAYVTRVPFENVSKIYRWKHHGLTTVPDVQAQARIRRDAHSEEARGLPRGHRRVVPPGRHGIPEKIVIDALGVLGELSDAWS
jgi:hypothetical protein